ncbi:nicotinate-nucleotide--dimethylbenzimidazole phosphoribosyltransferase [Vibrio sp. JC009]|uniref:nicotinate-nucleotide--dimethylbenzimidazole phosphoribosyltransferase n=1 Tax=Vibrio sp. JC009 TaxID=2912314 RepID=UPI0023B16618|nr:nicotinate-nucleotide--dimethylbenzimidazole phosphoribosyltransferase [Vibrio sp. JC009]WED23106.1 nicotinate-nucleotide--dimethylbenzimidazole phosphoribosyltransferase [Vibrio sp. JC009]
MLENKYQSWIQNRIDQKTKPLGSLGELETLAMRLALIQSQGRESAVEKITLSNPTMLVFAGDHGIADEGVSIAPSAVTQQMVLNFLNDGAAVNCFCRVNGIELKVVDAGILLPVESDSSRFISQRLGERTNNFALSAAMTQETVQKGIELGQSVANLSIDNGSNILMFGEMGIGNTSSASAILSALSGCEAAECVGPGTGITQEQLTKKVALVAQGVERCKGKDPVSVLAEVGGYEIVQVVGAFLAAAQRNIPVLVDGFIITVAAYVAQKINPDCRDIMIFAHHSQEPGHKIVLQELEAAPLLSLGMRLGEGTGAAIAYSLVKAAAEFYNEMASFESAGVTV